MSKTSHTSNGALEDHGTLADSELEAVSGGTPKLLEYACKGTPIHSIVLHIEGGVSLGGTAMMGAISGASGAV